MGLWDLHQELSIRAVRGAQAGDRTATEGRFADVQHQVWRNEDRIERLLLLTDAMWELLTERLGVTEEELATKVTEIDGRSGPVDGRRPRAARRCGACDAAVPHDRATCLFCGHEQPGTGPFDAV
jgi:hypothetical protein